MTENLNIFYVYTKKKKLFIKNCLTKRVRWLYPKRLEKQDNRDLKMKNLIASIIATSTFINTPKSFVNSNTETSNIEKQNNQVKHGKNGEDGLNGGNGGNGGAGWLRGGNGGNGGNAVDSSVNPSPECTEQNVDELEYSALKEMCRQVIFTTISKSYDPLNHACVYPT